MTLSLTHTNARAHTPTHTHTSRENAGGIASTLRRVNVTAAANRKWVPARHSSYLPAHRGSAAAIYSEAKVAEVRISWIALRRMKSLSASAFLRSNSRGGLLVLPTGVSGRTAMPHSADGHNKTTSRPAQNALGGFRTTPHGRSGGRRPPPSQPPPVGRARCVHNHEVSRTDIG